MIRRIIKYVSKCILYDLDKFIDKMDTLIGDNNIIGDATMTILVDILV